MQQSSFRAKLRALWNPDMYHGWGKTKSYFEGWYYKFVSADEQEAFAVIPGLSLTDGDDSHAFIQVFDGKHLQTEYLKFDTEQFVPADDSFDLKLGDNHFNKNKLSLDHEQVSAELRFSDHVDWPKHLGAPGIMGWFSFVPFMQCYHGIVSMNASVSGTFRFADREINMDGGRLYMEKDWGVSFPKCWIWMQSNHFSNTDQPISCTASVAHIPWLGHYFVGFIVGILFEGEVLRFATYTGAKMSTRIEGDKVFLSFRDRKHRLEITAQKAGTVPLISPIQGAMVGKVDESLQAEMAIKLFRKEILLYEGTGRHAGLEIAGDIDILLTEKK